jgi:hypothetical protein
LTVLATDLGDLLLSHLLRRHPIARRLLAIAWSRRGSVRGVWIVSRVWIIPLTVSRRTVALLDRITARHVPRYAASWNDRNLCPSLKMGTPFALDNSFQTVFYRGASPRCAAWRNTNAKRKSLSWPFSKVRGSRYLNVLRVENVFDTVHLLDTCIVDGDPDRLLISFEYSRFQFDSLSLDVLVSLNIHLSDYGFACLKSRLIESYPDLAFRWY